MNKRAFFAGGRNVPVAYTMSQIVNDPSLGLYEKGKLISILNNAENDGAGLISGRDIVAAAVGAGVAYVAAKGLGNTIASVYGKLDPFSQRRLQETGMIAGLLRRTGATQ